MWCTAGTILNLVLSVNHGRLYNSSPFHYLSVTKKASFQHLCLCLAQCFVVPPLVRSNLENASAMCRGIFHSKECMFFISTLKLCGYFVCFFLKHGGPPPKKHNHCSHCEVPRRTAAIYISFLLGGYFVCFYYYKSVFVFALVPSAYQGRERLGLHSLHCQRHVPQLS